MLISSLFSENKILFGLKSRDKISLFSEMVTFLIETETSLKLDKDKILEGLWKREREITTGIASKIAIPHTQINGITKTYGVMGISLEGIDYDSLDGFPVNIVTMLIRKENDNKLHLDILKNLATLMSKSDFCDTIIHSKDANEVFNNLLLLEKKYCPNQ